MKFWRENKIANEFEAEPAAVATEFAAFWKEQPDWYQNGIPLEAALRHWLSEHYGSWEDEGPDGFTAVYNAAYNLVFS